MDSKEEPFYNVIVKTETYPAETREGRRNPIAERRIVKVQTIRGRNSKPITGTFSQVRLRKNGLYDILQVPKNATADDLKRAYRRAVLRTHPDKNPTSADKDELNERFKEVVAAYKILSNPSKRKIYDKYGLDGVKFQEESQCSSSTLWFMFSPAGRVISGVVLVATCFFCCFCCFKCFCNCFCNCCCNHCGKDETMDETFEYNFSTHNFQSNESHCGHENPGMPGFFHSFGPQNKNKEETPIPMAGNFTSKTIHSQTSTPTSSSD
uniref:J domain-containing protein n=1 Tax=Panagrolaimus sp. JU765 TaxID=591449 RepID=A0AC34Q8A9_9BILA